MKRHEPPFLLKELKIEVTHKCPLACIHCSSDASPSRDQEIDLEECKRIISEAAEMGASEIAFSGGEPLIWGRLSSAVESASALGLSVTLYSSGNVNDIRYRLDDLFRCGTKRIVFSIFGSEATIHEGVTRSDGSFERTIEASKHAMEVGLEAEFHFVPFSHNYQELAAIAELSAELETSTVSVLRFVPQGRGVLLRESALDRLQNEDLKKIIERLRNDGHNIRTGSPYNFLMLNPQPECCAAIDRLIIGPDQRIYPCDAFKQIGSSEVVGTNDYSHLGRHSLSECWEKSPYLNAIREYLTTDFEEPCHSCESVEICLSGCLAQKVVKNGDLRKSPDPMCFATDGVGSHEL